MGAMKKLMEFKSLHGFSKKATVSHLVSRYDIYNILVDSKRKIFKKEKVKGKS